MQKSGQHHVLIYWLTIIISTWVMDLAGFVGWPTAWVLWSDPLLRCNVALLGYKVRFDVMYKSSNCCFTTGRLSHQRQGAHTRQNQRKNIPHDGRTHRQLWNYNYTLCKLLARCCGIATLEEFFSSAGDFSAEQLFFTTHVHARRACLLRQGHDWPLYGIQRIHTQSLPENVQLSHAQTIN